MLAIPSKTRRNQRPAAGEKGKAEVPGTEIAPEVATVSKRPLSEGEKTRASTDTDEELPDEMIGTGAGGHPPHHRFPHQKTTLKSVGACVRMTVPVDVSRGEQQQAAPSQATLLRAYPALLAQLRKIQWDDQHPPKQPSRTPTELFHRPEYSPRRHPTEASTTNKRHCR